MHPLKPVPRFTGLQLVSSSIPAPFESIQVFLASRQSMSQNSAMVASCRTELHSKWFESFHEQSAGTSGNALAQWDSRLIAAT